MLAFGASGGLSGSLLAHKYNNKRSKEYLKKRNELLNEIAGTTQKSKAAEVIIHKLKITALTSTLLNQLEKLPS